LLRDINLGNKIDIGENVAVIGGGNAAIDAIRTINRLGKNVKLLYRRTKNEMPAWEEEVNEALKEGINMEFLVAPVRIISEKGKITKLECIKMELGDIDKSGRRKPVPKKGSEFTIEIDTLVPAISQEPDIDLIAGSSGLKLSRWKTIEVDTETMYTGEEKVFAGGDVVSGPGTVTKAMADGKAAAKMIDKFIKGEELTMQYAVTKPVADVPLLEMTDEEIENLKRFKMPMLKVKDRINNFKETELGFSRYQAVCEAKHCLRCDKEEKE
jgi:NADH-quinone oxidoreductase subunit F